QQARQPLRSASARYDAKIDFRLSERGVFAGDANVTGQRQLAAAAQTVAVHHGNYRLRECIDRVEEATLEHDLALRNRRALGELSDIRAGNERLVPGPGE